MKNFFIIVFGLLIGAVIVLAIISFVKPATITTNKAPVTSTVKNNPPQIPKTTPTTSSPTPTTPTNPTPTPMPIKGSPLTTKTWHWVSNNFSSGGMITSRDPSRFSLIFKADGTFSSSTDCNGIGGKYVIDGSAITFSQMIGTQMYCSGSQETEYRKVFDQSQTYSILKNGDLRIDVKYGGGYAIFH